MEVYRVHITNSWNSHIVLDKVYFTPALPGVKW